jgi:hypothetical protein
MDAKRTLEESEDRYNKRHCLDAAAQKEFEDGTYFFVESGIRAKLYEYAETTMPFAPLIGLRSLLPKIR